MTPTKEQLAKIEILEKRLMAVQPPAYELTFEDYFMDDLESDFEIEDELGDSWYIHECLDNECPEQWHLISYGLKKSRKNTKKYIRLKVLAEGSKTPLELVCDENDQTTIEKNWAEIRKTLIRLPYDYYAGWAKYFLHCAKTGEDPLLRVPDDLDDFFDECIAEAAEHIDYAKEWEVR